MAVRFFETGEREEDYFATLPYNAPRAIVASAEQLKLSRSGDRIDKRPTSAWQTASWQMFDAIGEVHYAFELIGQIMSRVRLYIAVVEHPDQAPVHIYDYLKRIEDATGQRPEHTAKVLKDATDILDELQLKANGGISNVLRLMALNLSVPGEMYLVNHNDQWYIASTDELTQSGDTLKFKRSRSRSSGTRSTNQGETVDPNAFVARIWRAHPRYTDEPDSSMIGVLDDCELLVLLQQAMRSIARSRMNAGIMFIPDGITSFVANSDGMSVEEALARASVESVEQESAQATVVPQILKGPLELGNGIKWIPYGRQIDAAFTALVDRTLQRILQGLDIPKEIVSGLAETRYSNAIVIDDNLFKAHIEPLVLLAVDAITSVYLRPQLKKRTGLDVLRNVPLNPMVEEVEEEAASNIVNRIVVWADTSAIVTRPDRSQAANDGYDRKVLSAAAWRETRGFTEAEAPKDHEILVRTILERGQLPPEIIDAVVRSLDPTFFQRQRQEASQLPADVESMLNGDPGAVTDQAAPTPPGPQPRDELATPRPQDASGPTGVERARNGQSPAQGGPMPPRQPTPA